MCEDLLLILIRPRSGVSNGNIRQVVQLEPVGQCKVVVERDGTSARPINVDSAALVKPSSAAITSAKHLSSQTCPEVRLPFPSGVSPYGAYPFKLHDKYLFPWGTRISNNQLWLQSVHCMGVASRDGCRPCRELFLKWKESWIASKTVSMKTRHWYTSLSNQYRWPDRVD